MPLLLSKVLEGDLDRLVEVRTRAFAGNPWNEVMFPSAVSSRSHTALVERERKILKSPDSVFVKITDTERDNELIALARWYIYKHERPESEWNKKNETTDWGEGANVDAVETFMGELHKRRKQYIAGRPHCLLSLLVTDPKHQRKGAGNMLVKWGTDIADELGIDCYLEGSAAGYQLYRENGFQDVDYVDMDMAKYGSEGVERYTCMVRPAKIA
ncbi:hypothetical protein MMC13_004716 [Lambiella insularis]|nr:hypothetical protein [Lambiella insularis]